MLKYTIKNTLSITFFTATSLLPAITLATDNGIGIGINIDNGIDIYSKNCVACHQESGSGIPGAFPSLKSSTTLANDLQETVNTVVKGRKKSSPHAFGTQLTTIQLISVIAYIRTTYGKSQTNLKTLYSLISTASNELNIQISRDKIIMQKKNKLNNMNSPNNIFAQSYFYEQDDVELATYGYRLIIENFSSSYLMIEAIKRLDRIERK